MSVDIGREAEELSRYYSELGRRLAHSGVRNIGELLSTYEQLRRALDAVSRQEIGWAAEQAGRRRGRRSGGAAERRSAGVPPCRQGLQRGKS